MLTTNQFSNIAYDPDKGMLFRVQNDKCTTNIIRRILPDEDNNVFCLSSDGKQVKRKAHNLCWIIANGEIPAEHYVLQLQENDLRLCNLVLLHKEDYVKYRDAEYNLSDIAIIPDKRCTYTLRYMQEGKLASAKGLEYNAALKLRKYLTDIARDELDKYFTNLLD